MLKTIFVALALGCTCVAFSQLSANPALPPLITISVSESAGFGVLTRTDVQRELKLSDSQWQRVSLLIQKPADQADTSDRDLRSILSQPQYNRYVELDLQLAGASAFTRQDIAEKLGLTKEQRCLVHQIQSEMTPITAQSGDPDLDQLIQEAKKQHEESDRKLLAVLTDKQREQWAAMQGKPFKFEAQSGN